MKNNELSKKDLTDEEYNDLLALALMLRTFRDREQRQAASVAERSSTAIVHQPVSSLVN